MNAQGDGCRVLTIINDLTLGGAQRALLGQTTALARAGWRPEVASLELVPQGELGRAFAAAQIPVHRLRRPGETRLAIGPRLLVLLARHRPDLVHTHLAAAGVAGRLAAHRHGVRGIVTTLHNLTDWEEKRSHPLRWLDRRTLPLADAIVTVSDAIRQALAAALPALAPRAVTVRNGVDLSAFGGATAGDREPARAVLGYARGDFVVGAVARLDPRKGIDTLIEAAAIARPACPALKLLLVGDGPERPHLAALARAHGIASRVHWAGHQADARPYLAAMDLFAAPSRTEGFGLAIIEALAAGLPVAGSRVGGIPEVIEDGVCGLLVPPGEPAAWARVLAHLGDDREKLRRFADAAPIRARLFAVEESATAIARVYERVLARATSREEGLETETADAA